MKLTPIDGQSTQVNVAEMPLTIEDGASEAIPNSAEGIAQIARAAVTELVRQTFRAVGYFSQRSRETRGDRHSRCLIAPRCASTVASAASAMSRMAAALPTPEHRVSSNGTSLKEIVFRRQPPVALMPRDHQVIAPCVPSLSTSAVPAGPDDSQPGELKPSSETHRTERRQRR